MLSKSLICFALLLDRTKAVDPVDQRELLKGKGYEVREVTIIDDGGTKRTSTLYFIESPQGLLEASKSKNYKFPAAAVPDLIEDFTREGKNKRLYLDKCLKATRNFLKRKEYTKAPKKMKGPCANLFAEVKKKVPFEYDDFKVMVVDRDAVMITNQDEAKQYCKKNGLKCGYEKGSLYAAGAAGPCNDWHYKSKTWSKNLNEEIDVDKKFTSSGNSNVFVKVVIEAEVNVSGSAQLDYKYKKKWCVPYKFALQKVTLEASFSVSDGDITITGEAAQTFDGVVWDIASPTIATGVFMIGLIPVVYRFQLPIRAGTGDLELEATGEVDLDQKLEIDGHYKYICTQSSCSKVSSSFNDNGAIDPGNVNYELAASVKIEPFMDVAIKADIYWNLIWAKVGLRPSFPISLTGYFGNTCGDGDGLDGNEMVWAVYLELKFRAGVFFIMKWMDNENYYEFYAADLLVQDLLSPSTAFSPEIRPTINNPLKKVTLLTSLRECVDHVMTDYQDFTVDWDDGSSTQNIDDLTGTKTLTHTYSSAGTYTIKVKHDNDAYTERDITITTMGTPPKVTDLQASCLIEPSKFINPIKKYMTTLTGSVKAAGSPSDYEIFNNGVSIHEGKLVKYSSFKKVFNQYIEEYNLFVRACNTVACSQYPLSGTVAVACEMKKKVPVITGVKTFCTVKLNKKKDPKLPDTYTTFLSVSIDATDTASTYEVYNGTLEPIYEGASSVFNESFKGSSKGYSLEVKACNSQGGCSDVYGTGLFLCLFEG
eukprot:CAMPEP_0194325190 /NCGR_PEP_ID=MMETSP0171-20130528/29091_1 /TAXON_ID=218684 /ORGANISM="Corethron pennatum, Strain L29A3" /LENGTH=763 /DNA_ID=CAMNT_0039084233 /DNA_START=61 /DNA_END=2352 /DNA_ORIENTATION=-